MQQSTAAIPGVPRERMSRWTHQRLFFSGMAIVAAATVLLGFAPTYFLRALGGRPALSPLVHVHGALYTAWIVLLIVQTNLAATGRIGLHRKLGMGGGALVIGMLVTGYAVAIEAGRHWISMPGQFVPGSLQFFIVPLGGLVVFGSFVGAGFWLRHRPEFHRRFMLLATIELLNAAIDRLPGVGANGLAPFYLGTDAFLLALVIYDLAVLRRLHPATLFGGAFLIGAQVLRVLVADTVEWLAVARWLTT